MMLKEIAERRAGQSKHRGNGQIDLASGDDQHLGQRHDRDQTEIDTRKEDGVLGKELRRREAAVKKIEDEQQAEHPFPTHERAEPKSRPRAREAKFLVV